MKTLSFLLLCLLQLSACASLKQSDMIFYTDQNNNLFTLSKFELIYRAVKPNESSSGIYSGGTDKRVAMNSSEYKLLEKLAIELIESENTHAQRREMRTAVLVIKTAAERKEVLLYPSTLRLKFEQNLQNIAGLDR